MNATRAASLNDWSDEAALVRAAKDGDTAAFETLVLRYSNKVFRVAQHISRCSEDAEEIAQETFLKALQHLKNFEERSRISTWLIRIAVNIALERLSRSRRRRLLSIDEEEGEQDYVGQRIADWRPNPEQLYSRSELGEILKQALESLSSGYSTVFLLRDIEGFSIAETAEALGLSEPAVKTRLVRARLQLRERLSQHFGYGRTAKGAAVARLSSELQSMAK